MKAERRGMALSSSLVFLVVIIIFTTSSSTTTCQAFLHRSTRIHHYYPQQQQRQKSKHQMPFITTSLQASIKPSLTTKLSRLFTSPFLRRQNDKNDQQEEEQEEDDIVEIDEELEEEDFLLADVKPKYLVHERDFHRETMRVAAWDEYVLVSILCTSISYSALQSFTLNPEHQGIYIYEVILMNTIHIVAGLSVLCGLYATMVFAISILYGKTALGLEQDIQYDNFLEATGTIRIYGFRAFSAALALFAIMVVLVLAEDLPISMHLPIGGICLAVLGIGFRDWKILVDNATQIYLDD